MYKRHLALMEEYDVYTPKHHLVVHLLSKCGFWGTQTCMLPGWTSH